MTRPNASNVAPCVLAALALALGGPTARADADPADQQPPAAGELRFQVVKVSGKARWGPLEARPDGDAGWQQVQIGDVYGSGVQINTPLRSKVQLALTPAQPPTIVMIEPLTLASVDDLFARQDAAVTRLGLAYGAIRAGVAESEVRSEFEIRAPVATLSKRGTWGFRLSVEFGTGRFEISLADRGLLELIHQSGQRGFILPGQSMNQYLMRWIESAQFNQPVSVQDLFGLQGAELFFNMLNNGGLGVIGFGNNPINILNLSGREDRGLFFASTSGDLGGVLGGVQQLRLAQALQSRIDLGQNIQRRPEGDFGVGFGRVPFTLGIPVSGSPPTARPAGK